MQEFPFESIEWCFAHVLAFVCIPCNSVLVVPLSDRLQDNLIRGSSSTVRGQHAERMKRKHPLAMFLVFQRSLESPKIPTRQNVENMFALGGSTTFLLIWYSVQIYIYIYIYGTPPMDLPSFGNHWYVQWFLPFWGYGECSKKGCISKNNLKALGQTFPGNLESRF